LKEEQSLYLSIQINTKIYSWTITKPHEMYPGYSVGLRAREEKRGHGIDKS